MMSIFRKTIDGPTLTTTVLCSELTMLAGEHFRQRATEAGAMFEAEVFPGLVFDPTQADQFAIRVTVEYLDNRDEAAKSAPAAPKSGSRGPRG